MLQIKIEDYEAFDERSQKFIYIKGQTICLEHSLVSISKWESKYQKPFLGKSEKTKEETLDYIRFMTITQNVDPSVYNIMTDQQIKTINEYIDRPMSAIKITRQEGKGAVQKPITSEEIYYAMVAYQIPFECQKWHFNRLMMLIHICDEKNKPKKKVRKSEVARRNRSLNAARRAKYNTRG